MDKIDGNASYGNVFSLPSCILTLESCFQRPETIEQILSFNSMSLQPSSTPPHQLEMTSHSDLRTAMNIVCHLCQRRGHMAKECPNTKDNHCLRTPTMPPVVNPILTPAKYHAHYPIITPPTQLPFSNTTRQQCLADLY
ncbi:hypothetical protein O181_113835 [Austropuccinia psidii MF-1]|uniref:CCHC-type domain-containing protein n=1 Tax=Austropuccinia psidii MF-1 TaxID=1389203 RepID=A0A9Q3K795_9BASI|nr:hypothetical protein [Austropuccinia psidii MF-1]